MGERLIPTGKCWCGCGDDAELGKFFKSGHDRRAESAVIKVEYGSVVEFLAKKGYVPGGKNPMEELRKYLEKKGQKTS